MKYMKVIIGPDTRYEVVHNIYPDGLPVNPNMMDPNIGGSRKKCRHIYEDVGSEVCPDCGRYTHETDWNFQHQLHREWISSGKAESQGWTSI